MVHLLLATNELGQKGLIVRLYDITRLSDALAGYLTEVAEVGEMPDGRYDDIKSGRVKPIDGEAFFDGLRQREDELLKQRNPK